MPSSPPESSSSDESRRFEEDLEVREEAVAADEDGALPPGATHEIKEEDDGERTIERRRFTAG
jgi:hypothetical protein